MAEGVDFYEQLDELIVSVNGVANEIKKLNKTIKVISINTHENFKRNDPQGEYLDPKKIK